MNKAILMGRLTRDPDVRQSSDTTIAHFAIAVDRRGKNKETDFFNCTAFGKLADFVGNYLHKGTKIVLTGRIQNDNYTNRNGEKVYSVQIMADEIEFAESKSASEGFASGSGYNASGTSGDMDDFMHIPDDVSDEGLPWN